MRPQLYSYTDPVTAAQNTTMNDGVNFTNSKVLLAPIVSDGRVSWALGGDGQEPFLTSVISQGSIIELHFYCMQGNVGDGYDFLAAMFNKRDKRTKTLVVRDLDDLVVGVGRSYSATCRNVGVMKPQGRSVVVRVALVSEVLLTTSATTETTWTNASSGSKVVTVDKGNIEALPVFDITPNASNTNGNKYWRRVDNYNYTDKAAVAYHIDVTNGGLDTSALINFSSIFFTVSAVNAVVTTIPYTARTGTFPSIFPYMIYRGGEQLRVTARTGDTSGNLTVVRGVNGSVATSHGAGAQLALSKMAFDGRDVRIFLGLGSGSLVEVPYYLGTGANAMNTTVTKFWVPVNYAPRALGTIATSIDNIATTMQLSLTGLTGDFMPANGMVLFDDPGNVEICPYDTFDVATGVFTGLVRGQRGSTAVGHASGVTVRAVNDFRFYYGNPSATAPVYTTALKPPFALDSSNDQQTYNTFGASAINTIDEFKSSAGGNNVINYTGDASGVAPFTTPAPTDPNDYIGISIIEKGSYGQWLLAVPFGYTSASTTTAKRLNLPANQAFLQSFDGANYTNQALAAQGTTWSGNTSYTITPSSGTASRLLFYLKNTQTTAYARRAAVQLGSIVVNISTASGSAWGRPYVSMGAEQTLDFDVDTIITNTTTNEAIRIVRPDCPVGQTIRVNCLLKTVTYLGDNSNAFPSLQRYQARDEWMRFLQGANTLTCSQAGLDIVPSWQGRQNSFG